MSSASGLAALPQLKSPDDLTAMQPRQIVAIRVAGNFFLEQNENSGEDGKKAVDLKGLFGYYLGEHSDGLAKVELINSNGGRHSSESSIPCISFHTFQIDYLHQVNIPTSVLEFGASHSEFTVDIPRLQFRKIAAPKGKGHLSSVAGMAVCQLWDALRLNADLLNQLGISKYDALLEIFEDSEKFQETMDIMIGCEFTNESRLASSVLTDLITAFSPEI